MKKLTLNAVTGAVSLLLSSSIKEETTTLEVKELLRYLGFHATQQDVSSKVDSLLGEDFGLVYETVTERGANFRVYFSKDRVTPASTFSFR